MKKSLINASMISVATAVVLSMTGCGGGGSGGQLQAGLQAQRQLVLQQMVI